MKERIRLFIELFLMMVIVIILTSMIFSMNYGFSYLWREHRFLFVARFFIVLMAAGALSFFETVNLMKVFQTISGAIKKIRHTDLRERVYLADDYLFSGIVDDLNGFLDDMSDKLNLIKDDLAVAEQSIQKGDNETALKNIREIQSLFNSTNKQR